MNVTQAELDALLRRRGLPPGHPGLEPRRNKYGAQRTEYDGRTYDSKAEAEYAMRLDLRVRAGEIAGWGRQPTVVVCTLENGSGLSWRYRPMRGSRLDSLEQGEKDRLVLQCRLDFRVWRAEGGHEFHEVKGYRVRDWPLRERILRLAGVPLVVIR